MRIVRVEVEPLPLTLREPYTIAYETITSVDNVVVRLVTDGPHVGLGVSAPDHGVTGETVAASEAALRDVVVPLLTGEEGLRRALLTEQLIEVLPDLPATRAAVDMALYDLLGKHAGVPVWRLLGGYRASIPTSVTLFISPVADAVERARAFAADGFRALKIKGGVDVDEDIARVLAIRHAVGDDLELRFDANQGYTADDAGRFFEATRSVGLTVLEQPTPADQLAAMREVVGLVGMPVMADESILSLTDAFRFARRDAMDMINLKLPKVGGLDAAVLINGVARAAGLEVMVGCGDEAALSIASGLAFALSRRNVELADLDGHLDFDHDPTAGCVHLRDGVLWPDDGPGFGIIDL